METTLRDLRKHEPQVARKLAEARSAANLRTRRQNEREEDNRVLRLKRSTHRRLQKGEREAESWFRGRIRVRVEENDQPRLGVRTPRKLHSRADPDRLPSSIVGPVFTGPDGFQSIHFQFTARGLAGSRDRLWRSGEAAAKMQYIARYEALEEGATGFWSNVAEDRAELAAFGKVIEEVERHDRKNANVYCEEIIALPCELTAAQRRECVRHICAYFEARELPFAVGIHKPDPDGDQRNFHCHIVYSLRPAQRLEAFVWDFEPRKVGDINTPEGIRARRKAVTTALNVALAKAGLAKRHTDKTHAARGISALPGRKRGQALTAIKRKEERELERGLEAVREIERIATEAANSLDRATANLAGVRQKVDARVRQILNSVRLTMGYTLFSAPSTRINLENARDQVAAKLAAAQDKLEKPGNLIRSQVCSARETVTTAKARFSEIERLRDRPRAMQKADATPATVVGAARKPISKPTRVPPPPVAPRPYLAANRVSVVDIRTLDNEPDVTPLPLGRQSPSEQATSPAIEMAASNSKASKKLGQLPTATTRGEGSDTNSPVSAPFGAEASTGTAEVQHAGAGRSPEVVEPSRTESSSALEAASSQVPAPQHRTAEVHPQTSGTPHCGTDHSQNVRRGPQAEPPSPTSRPSPGRSAVNPPVHVSPIENDDADGAKAGNDAAAVQRVGRLEVVSKQHPLPPPPSVDGITLDAPSANVLKTVRGALPSTAATKAIEPPSAHRPAEPQLRVSGAKPATFARELGLGSSNEQQQDAAKETQAKEAAKVHEGRASEAALRLSEAQQQRLLEILGLIRTKNHFVTRRKTRDASMFDVAGLDDNGLEFLRSDPIRAEAEPALRAIQLTQIQSLKPAWEWLRANVKNPDVISFEGRRFVNVAVPEDILAVLTNYVRHPLITRQLERGLEHQRSVETTVDWIRTYGQDPKLLILQEGKGNISGQAREIGVQIEQVQDDPRIKAALRTEYARRKAVEAEEVAEVRGMAKNRNRER